MAQRLKHLPPIRETWVRSLGQEDPLEKEMATHSNIRAWRILWMEEPSRLQSTGSQRVGHNWATSLSLSITMVGKGGGEWSEPFSGKRIFYNVHVVTNFMCHLHWIRECADICLNIISGRIYESVSGWDWHLNQYSSRWPSPMWLGIVHPICWRPE